MSKRPVGRPQLPIDPEWPFATFASGLRALRSSSGLTYEEMARATNFCVSVLSEAAAGKRLPTLPVTLAFVRACGGLESDWERQWRELDALRRLPKAGAANG